MTFRKGAPAVEKFKSWLPQQTPGLSVGGEVGAFSGMIARREEDAGAVLDFGDGEDEPGVFGDDVGDEEVDFVGLVGDGPMVGAAMGVDAVEAAEHGGGGFDLDAQEAASGVEDEVVAFAVAVGLGDVESQRRGFEDEGEFGKFSATLGGLLVLLGGFFRL